MNVLYDKAAAFEIDVFCRLHFPTLALTRSGSKGLRLVLISAVTGTPSGFPIKLTTLYHIILGSQRPFFCGLSFPVWQEIICKNPAKSIPAGFFYILHAIGYSSALLIKTFKFGYDIIEKINRALIR